LRTSIMSASETTSNDGMMFPFEFLLLAATPREDATF